MRGAYGRAMATHTAQMPSPRVRFHGRDGTGDAVDRGPRQAGQPAHLALAQARADRGPDDLRPDDAPCRPARAVTAEGDRPVQIIYGHGDEEDLRPQPISHRPRPGRPPPGPRGGSESARRHRHPARAPRALTGPAAKATEPTTPRRCEPGGTYPGRSRARAIPATSRVQVKQSEQRHR